MKQLTTTLLFLAISFFTFAQSTLTEKMLNDHAQRLVSDPMKWMKEDVSPNFVLSGSEGISFNYQQIMARFEGVKVLSRELADVKISQYGNVAVATGISTSKNTIKANGMPLNYHERVTYVFQNQKDKWILMSAQHTNILPMQTPVEEAAIKKVLDDETVTFHTNPQETFSKHWNLSDKSFLMGNWDNGNFNNLNIDLIKQAAQSLKADDSKSVKSNHRINIKGSIAIVDFDQVSTNGTGAKSNQHNIVILEKVNDAWKIIAENVNLIPSKN